MPEESKTEQWLAWLRSGEMERVRALEEEVARAWWDSLTIQQREIYAELQESGHGLYRLHDELIRARLAARKHRPEREN
jgi:hypothetical protein